MAGVINGSIYHKEGDQKENQPTNHMAFVPDWMTKLLLIVWLLTGLIGIKDQ